MKLEIYGNILTKLLRKFPGEQRMCLTLISLVAEARIIASRSNTMEINAITSALDDMTMDSDSVANFLTPDVAFIIATNLDNPVFKNDFNIANDFIDAINKRFSLSYTKIEEPVVDIVSADLPEETEEKEPEDDTDFSDGLEDNFITDADKTKLDDAGIKLSPDGSITISTPMTAAFTEENKAKEETPVIKVTSNHIPQENKHNYNKNNFKNKNRR